MRYILVFAFALWRVPAWAHSPCEISLLSANPVRRALAMIQVALTDKTEKPHVRPLEVYEVVTGLNPDAIALGLAGQIQLVRTLQPIQGWKELIRIVQWHGHHYSVTQSWKDSQIYNSFWGRPINIHAHDVLALSLHHQAGRDEIWLNALLGPVEADRLQINQLKETLQLFDEEIEVELLEYQSTEGTQRFLRLSKIRNRPDSYLFIQKLISTMQDRYFEYRQRHRRN